jgi:hypothetical protein
MKYDKIICVVASCLIGLAGCTHTGDGESAATPVPGDWLKTSCDLLVLASDVTSYVNKAGGDAAGALAKVCQDFQAQQAKAKADAAALGKTGARSALLRPGASVVIHIDGIAVHGIVKPK